MSNIEKIKAEIERLKIDYLNRSYTFVPATMEQLLDFIDSLPEDASCVYDANKLTPTPSVNIEDVARVQFASHAHVFDRKRKAVFDWEQFKEVAGIFYGFGKRDSLPEEKPTLTVEDIKTILDISFWNNDPEKILEEYNRINDERNRN